MRNAVVDFQQKHTLIDQADIKRSTLEALARPLLENDFAALQRVLAERAAHAGGIIEDGSIPPTTTLSRAATASAIRSRIWSAPRRRRCSRAWTSQTPEDALAFFRRRTPADMRWLRVAVRFPPLPEYYGRRAAPWTCPPRSIAATSGTTSRSTPPACACRSRASASRRSRCS